MVSAVTKILRFSSYLLACCIFVSGLGAAPAAFAQPYVNSGDVFPDVWDNFDMAWENGNPSGYSEGQTAAMVAEIRTNSTAQHQVDFCLQVEDGSGANLKYAFSSFSAAWNATYNPTTFPNGTAISFSDTLGPISAYNADIISVSAPSLGNGQCDAEYLGVTVVFQKLNASTSAYFAWGGVLSQEGAALPAGASDPTVPAGKSASFINGTFQSRVAGAGDKTINFKGQDISLNPGINLLKTVTTENGTCGVDDAESITVPLNATIKFCFVIQSTGDTPLIDVTLVDSTLGVDLTSSLVGLTNEDGDGLADDLADGSSATAEYLWVATMDIDNIAIATGSGIEVNDTAMASVYFCGDGNVDPNEQCDDGNMVDGDGCNTQCQNEYCGDSITQPGLGEQCDDGNLLDNDGCDSQCQNEYCGDGILQSGIGEECDDGDLNSEDGCDSNCQLEYCGDGIIQAGLGEQCDDSNTDDEDGCNNLCQLEYCGDGVTQSGLGEECDDGNSLDNDGCNANCLDEFCGDGVVQTALGEQCDDGNNSNNDGCSNQCQNEFCGDGIQQSSEACDDGNSDNTDGCTNACELPACGDGFIQSGEQCDDGNTVNNDGCSNQCQNEFCGDGIQQSSEACDDGNSDNTDGC
ncbi:MAG: DUF4215 domain-containing protein, partial [Bdellovibrionales bacterium]|nr:DUF4215 domain-containing protein [Bdellovibrionales bacterium]